MRISALFLSAFFFQAFGQAVPATDGLAQVRSVYLLSMGSGLDQYLANQLTSGKVLLVVTDPAKADAVLTDRLGVQFEQKLKELYPEPAAPKPAPPKPAPKKDTADSKDAKEPEAKGEPKTKDEGIVRLGSSNWGRGEAMFFWWMCAPRTSCGPSMCR